jgi:hypothetical protein
VNKEKKRDEIIGNKRKKSNHKDKWKMTIKKRKNISKVSGNVHQFGSFA